MSVHHGAGFDPSALAHISYLDSDSSNQTDLFHPCFNTKQSDPLDDATLGGLATSLLIGYLINWGLLGLLTSQVYTYYMGFPNDRRRLKLFVYSLYLIELAQTIMATRDAIVVYAQGLMNSKDMMNLMKDLMNKAANGTSPTDGAFGKDFCDFLLRKHLTINDVHLLWLTVPVTAGIVGFIGQIFFAYRLWVLSESVLLSALIVSFGSLATASALICGGRMLFLKKIMDGIRDPLFLVSCGLWNGFAALCDVIIAACMSYYLSRRDTTFSETQILLKKLKKLTIETGALTATAAISNVILYVGFRSIPKVSVYFVIPAAAIAKLYSISILSSLNSRLLFTGGRYSMKTGISSVDNASRYDSGDRLLLSRGEIILEPQSAAEVRVERHTITWREGDRPLRNVTVSEKKKPTIKEDIRPHRNSRAVVNNV